jgi:beta-RFAP synthase
MSLLLACCLLALAFCLGVVRVRTASRLHFGILSLPAKEPTLSGRWFGGVGLMVETPGVALVAEPASEWSAEGPLADRALTFARQFKASATAADLSPHRLKIEQAAPEHMGLGTGTQLALAVARALSLRCGWGHLTATELAIRVGRGCRSALGIHGFEDGGFLVEGGKRQAAEISPLVLRHPFPETWTLILVLCPWGKGLHGADEHEAFQRLQGHPVAITDLCRLVLLGMLPALVEHDYQGFSEALYEFNMRVGSIFAPIQGGTYVHPRVAELIAWIRQQGIHGVGQSSWGPAVFALLSDQEQAAHLAEGIRQTFALNRIHVLITRARNAGAETAEMS